MAEMLLINPRRRRRTTRRRKGFSTARRRAPTRARRRVARRRVRRRNPANTFGVPRYGYRRMNPAHRRRRRNPNGRRGVMGIVQPAFMGAAGALTLDIAWGYLPIPMNLKTGMLRHVVKGVGAIGLGYLVNMVASRKVADEMTKGAMTVVIHGCMREVAQQFMPNVPLDGLGYYSAGTPVGVGAYVGGMGAYVGSEGGASPYLAADTLNQPFAGPSAAQMARAEPCIENEANMGHYYS